MINPLPSEGMSFYPAAWHMLASLIAISLGCEIEIAVNALNFVIMSAVFPLGVLFFLGKIFPGNKIALILGSVFTLAFADFPWSFMVFGPLYPNLLSMALFPSFCGVFITATNQKLRALILLKYLVVLFFGVVALATSQPNTIFLGIASLTPYCAARLGAHVSSAKGAVLGKLSMALFVIVVIVFWLLLYGMPVFQQGVLSDSWPAFTSVRQAIANIVFMAPRFSSANLLVGLLVLLGAFRFISTKQNRWLVASYILMGFFYLLDVSTDGILKHITTGFWYCDSYRIAANLSMIAIPLSVSGSYFLIRLLSEFFWKRKSK